MNASLYTYQIIINDTSPMFTWSDGWQQCFDVSGCSPSSPGAYGVGESYRYAPVNNSYVREAKAVFTGDAIELFGVYDSPASDLLESVVGVQMENEGSNFTVLSSSDTLETPFATAEGLSDQYSHTVGITSTGPFNFTHALVSFTSSQPLTSYSLPYWDPAIEYSGNWTRVDVEGLSNGTAQTSQYGAARLNFTGVGVIVYGTVNYGHGSYSIFVTSPDTDSRPFIEIGTTYANRSWIAPETVLFYSVRLPGKENVLNLLHYNNESSISISSITVLQGASEPDPTSFSSASSTPTVPNLGAIAGGILGGLSFFAVLVLVSWYVVRMRRSSSDPTPFRIDVTSPWTVNEERKTIVAPVRERVASIEPETPNTESALVRTTRDDIEAQTPAGIRSNSSEMSFDDLDETNGVVDRVLELLAARIDFRTSGNNSETTTSRPPQYKDIRRAQ